MGTPTDQVWPGVTALPEFQSHFPAWAAQNLYELFQGVDPEAIDLMAKMLTYDPARRISAKEALQHPYFDDMM